MSHVDIHFRRGGGVTVAPQGYPGPKCLEATRPYEEALQGQLTRREENYSATPRVENTQQREQQR